MTFELTLRRFARVRLAFLGLLIISICATGIVYAQSVDVTLVVKVSDKNSGESIRDAQISIPREKAGEVRGTTDKTGSFVRKETTFVLSNSYKLTVTAPGYNLSDQPLDPGQIEAASKERRTYEIKVQLTRSSSSASGNTSGQGTTGRGSSGEDTNSSSTGGKGNEIKGGGDGERKTEVWLFLSNMVDTAVRILGWLFIAIVGIAIFVWLLGYRLSLYRTGQLTLREEVGVVLANTRNISDEVRALKKQQEEANKSLVQDVDSLRQLISNSDKGVGQIPTGNLQPRSRDLQVRETSSQLDNYTSNRKPPRSPKETARLSFVDLIHDYPVSPEPIYLNTEARNSPAGTLEDSNIYLTEVNNNQGTFVLFADQSGSGWVFPNPTLAFKPHLSRVFSHLTEEMFDLSKETIEPTLARRLEDGRWRIESQG